MDERDERSALLSALTTEHFVLQTANNSTYSEASASQRTLCHGAFEFAGCDRIRRQAPPIC